jgi:hypothetical protein
MAAVKKILVTVSLLFYVVACCLIAFKDTAADGGLLGIICLLFGWLSFTSGFAAFVAWLANFPYFLNVVLVLAGKKTWMRIATTMLSIVSLFLSFGAFGVSQIMKDEGGTMQDVSFGPGLFLWMISFLIMITAAVLPSEKKPVEVHYINNPNPIK